MKMKRPDENDDKYYPHLVRENLEWYILDLEVYCDCLEEENKNLKRELKDERRKDVKNKSGDNQTPKHVRRRSKQS